MDKESKKVLEDVGRSVAEGVITAISKWFVIGIAIAFMFLYALTAFGVGVDDSDLSKWDRSGLRVHTDAKTGIQYLSDGRGGLIVRVAAK